ncbi:hypothetical protein [Timonella sp. A28]|uniref:hypothetical protein n=1 Tax=Timonella sp. A28 TaxID=3442640 RepID=UPI003EC0D98E
MSKPDPRKQNGHRRRQTRARILARDTHCALCGQWIDKTLTTIPGQHGPKCTGQTPNHQPCPGCIPHPHRAEVDEDIPVSRGGSPHSLDNCALMHRQCNQWKSNQTLAEAQQQLTTQNTQHTTATPQQTTTRINW